MQQAGAVVLVTGASTGIGFATAVRLARAGSIVYAGVRREEDGDQLLRDAGSKVRPVLLDVTDEAAPQRMLDEIERTAEGRLDALVNNAGIAVAGALEILPPADLRRQFDVNFFGAIALTQTLLPLLRSTRGRVVLVSSIGGKFATPYAGAYSASKFALEAAGDALRVELKAFGIGVSLIEPGVIKTQIWERGAQTSLAIFDRAPAALRNLYEAPMLALQELSVQLEKNGTPANRVAAAIEHAIFSKRPHTRYLVGVDARVQRFVTELPDRVRDALISTLLARAGKSATAPQRNPS